MTSTSPLVSVIMSVYNGETYVREAIDSILRQTFKDFEFLIIDDASNDRTPQILRSYDDPRVRLLTNDKNIGQSASSNRAIEISKGEYIARMDSDDVAAPERLQRQVEFLDANTGVSVVAAWVEIIRNDRLTAEVWRESSNPGVLAWDFTWRCPVTNPTVMIRREDFLTVGGYDGQYRFCEDHELCTRFIVAGKTITLIPAVLHRYRVWPGQIGTSKEKQQWEEISRSAHRYVEWLLDRSVDRQRVEEIINLYRGTAAVSASSTSLILAREVARRCGELYGGVGKRAIKNQMSDALLAAASTALDSGKPHQARQRILFAVAIHPLRAARPWTFRLLLQTFLRMSMSNRALQNP